ncbi:MAG: tRNA pseudouridine(55) synthase TruB [Victivallales bacterium]|nr:tRNA pseudouridine(55) synthase TruB [Victivallales bacterium]
MAQREYNHVDGILLVDKPADWSSFDVVNCVRRTFNLKKVGHCGTLDPFATGLLVLLLGKATRLQDSLMAESKVYTGTLMLGVETDSQDLTGTVTAQNPVPQLDAAALQAHADGFLGESLQIPPMHSAIKINGQPLYKLARKGREVERQGRPITITRFQLTAFNLPCVDFEIHCSKGTYIRTLGADLGTRIGCGAHLTALRREASGSHSVKDGYDIETVRKWSLDELKAHVTPLEQI